MNKKYSSLLEIMILVPLFSVSLYVCIYFGEITLTKINGAIASRYVAETSQVVDETAVKNLFTTEVGQTHIQNGGEHYWGTNDTITISKQEKAEGAWPISENGSPHNVVYEYLMEYGFDMVVSYTLENGQMVQSVNFRHPPGGLDLLRWDLHNQADDVIENALRERVTYSYTKLDYIYHNDSIIPGNAGPAGYKGTPEKAKDISFSNEHRTLILNSNTPTREFQNDFSSIERLVNNYDTKNGGINTLSDIRRDSGTLVSSLGGTSVSTNGQTEFNWSNNDTVSARGFSTAKATYPLHADLGLNIVPNEEYIMDIQAMEDNVKNLNSSWDLFTVDNQVYNSLYSQ